jgi:hypothetical protein
MSHLGYTHDVDDVATSLWASSLRSSSSPTSSISPNIDQIKKSSCNSSTSTLPLSPKKKQELEYQAYQKQQQIPNDNNIRNNNNKTKINTKPSMLAASRPKQYTIPSAPVLNSQLNLNRKLTMREERKQRELILEKEEKLKEKIKKDNLKKKALEIASSRGVYNPENCKKNTNHSKIFAKYGDNPGLFGGNSLENLTESARKKYLHQNSLATNSANCPCTASRSTYRSSQSSITSRTSMN